jgi:hypothetical protein
LEQVSITVNLRRGDIKNQYTDKTSCAKGHVYTPLTSRLRNNNKWRECLICRREYDKARYYRNKERNL